MNKHVLQRMLDKILKGGEKIWNENKYQTDQSIESIKKEKKMFEQYRE